MSGDDFPCFDIKITDLIFGAVLIVKFTYLSITGVVTFMTVELALSVQCAKPPAAYKQSNCVHVSCLAYVKGIRSCRLPISFDWHQDR